MRASNWVRFLCQAALALVSMLPAGMPVYGQGVPGYPDDMRYALDPREVALLPRYCHYTQIFRDGVPGGNNPQEIARWTSIMGPTFNAMHHYCWGLMNTNRALLLVREQRWREFHLRYSIVEFDYVMKGAPRNFIMLPEILTKKGENLIRLDKGQDGVAELQRAIELKPDYWPPYAALSDYYSKIGDLAKAREWLQEGLSFSPNTKALLRRLAELNSPQSPRKTEPPAER
jgi:hypothetical protein